jgi:predicted Zn-ribbon and HTH transcriptional regulator
MTAGKRGGAAAEQRQTVSTLSSRAERGILVAAPGCQRCNFSVPARAMGCKNPCPNCGTVYPLGDCSD